MYTKLIENYEVLTNNGYYNKGAYAIAEELGLQMKVGDYEYKDHFGDGKERCVFKVTLKKGGKQFTINFGQSFAEGSNEPTLYSVLCCLQKYDVGSFEDFCYEFNYDNDSRKAFKTYKAVLREFEGMQRLFNSDELDLLGYIQ